FSGNLPAMPCFNLSRSTIAFLTIAWQSDTLNNFDLCDFPDTGKAPSSGMNRSHCNALVASNNSSNVSALNLQTTNFSPSAVANDHLQRRMAGTGASNILLPFSTCGL